MTKITEINRETLLLIAGYRQLYGVNPTYRDLARVAGVSAKAIECRIRALRRKGLVVSDTETLRLLRPRRMP